MRFRIKRASAHREKEPPIEGAEQVEVPNKTLDGKDNPIDVWVYEVDSLDELLELVDEEGKIVVGPSILGFEDPEYDIVIYDDYIE